MDTDQRDVYSVSRLNSELRYVLEGSFPLIWIEGEISNLSTPRSGHLYFSLKDGHAQIRCALFRNRRNLLRFQPRDGDQVLARVRVTLYEPRGDCQLIVEHMEPAGAGSQRAAFERLKALLQSEGLFDSARKKPLPAFPTRIGVITSPSGAALRDILHVLRRRFPAAEVVLYPSAVQGEEAISQLRRALATAEARHEVDVIILARGGGAEEDLAVFNDEGLARDIAAARIPIVSAVGHETDFTIADFVADRRAPTPSAAAELVSPDRTALANQCRHYEQRLTLLSRRRLGDARLALRQLERRLQRVHPHARLNQQQQRLDELEQRLNRSIRQILATLQERLHHRIQRLIALHPGRRIAFFRSALDNLERRLTSAMVHRLESWQSQLNALARQLHAVSPLATLERGYSIVLRADDGSLVTDAAQVAKGDDLDVRMARGRLAARVTGVDSEDGDS
ncbi:MAG: exodeoxyribonuclease VII large subunit [Gammaproteobacteria bacterium]|nr:MAG: exodeoxyribonuclease VII large subunit [Gammaproteobacteria bacterium]